MSGRNYLDGGEAVVQAFRSLDIDYVMASPGSEWGAVWEAFARQKVSNSKGPTYLSCAHETLAVDLALGYTAYTGRMQAVMLHTGVGLLQGSMGIDAARRMGIPMLVVSGEALTFGEDEAFDPGQQWQSGLSVVGGTHRLAEPLTKWCNQASSTLVLYQQLVNAGELAQRTPAGPVYMTVPIETMRNGWTPPDFERDVPAAPKPVPAAADIEAVGRLLASSKRPAIITEEGGRDPESYAALIELAELLAIPVAEGPASLYANFPKTHELHQGHGRPPFLFEADVVLTVRCRAPWYPPSNRPTKGTLVAIDEVAIRPSLVYASSVADRFLEGDVASTLRLLADSVRNAGVDAGAVEERRKHWASAHKEVVAAREKAEAEASAKSGPISPVALVTALGKAAPADAIYVDETITHRGALLRHLPDGHAQSLFRPQGGLGQGLGMSLGLKLAAPDRPVISIIGDGSFMYNPVTQSLALARHEGLPMLIVIMNNHGYEAMKKEHHEFYPDGVAAAHDIYYGKPITEFDYAEMAAPFGGWGRTVSDAAELPGAVEEALAALADGKIAILNAKLSA